MGFFGKISSGINAIPGAGAVYDSFRGGSGKAQKQGQLALDEFGQVKLPKLKYEAIRSRLNPQYNQMGRQAQVDAMNSTRQIAQTGFDDIDRARINDIRNQQLQAERAARQAALQNLSARGLGGSGLGMMSALQAGQQAANTANDQFLQTQAMGLDRRMSANNALANQGSQLRGDELRKAEAQRIIDQFNNQNRTGLQQQRFGNQMDLAGARANVRMGLGQMESQRDKNKQEFVGNLIAAGSKAFTGGA